MHPKHQGANNRFFRTLVFLATGLTGLRPSNPWDQRVWHVANNEESFALYTGESSLPTVRNLVLRRKGFDPVYGRSFAASVCGLSPSGRKVDISANLTCGVPMQFGTAES